MKNKKQVSSIAVRLAALMERERIESLPRNYELLYDVYSGTNPDLTQEFVALGDIKTQTALDEIGRKYLPHQHEEGVLAHANEVMQSQMSSFLQLIQDESASLAEFEKVVGETTRAISSEKELDRAAIAESIEKLDEMLADTVKELDDIKGRLKEDLPDEEGNRLKSRIESLEARREHFVPQRAFCIQQCGTDE